MSLEVLLGAVRESVEPEAPPPVTSALAVSCSPNTNPEVGAAFCRQQSQQGLNVYLAETSIRAQCPKLCLYPTAIHVPKIQEFVGHVNITQHCHVDIDE